MTGTHTQIKHKIQHPYHAEEYTDPEVRTQHGVIRGLLINSQINHPIERFLGIPFAEPPRRFEDPEFYGQFPGGITYFYRSSVSEHLKDALNDISVARLFLKN